MSVQNTTPPPSAEAPAPLSTPPRVRLLETRGTLTPRRSVILGILGGENNPEDGTLYMYNLQEAARFCRVADGDPPFGQKYGQMTDHWNLTNKWWITFGLMNKTVDPSEGLDYELLREAL